MSGYCDTTGRLKQFHDSPSRDGRGACTTLRVVTAAVRARLGESWNGQSKPPENLMLKTTPLIVLTLLTAVFAVAAKVSPPAAAQSDMPDRLLRHVVMFGFKESSSEAEVQSVVDAFAALPSKISEVDSFEYGVNNSPEGLNDGLTHCFLVTFKSEADREAYLPHPAHQAFVGVLKPHLQKVVVVDYWAKR